MGGDVAGVYHGHGTEHLPSLSAERGGLMLHGHGTVSCLEAVLQRSFIAVIRFATCHNFCYLIASEEVNLLVTRFDYMIYGLCDWQGVMLHHLTEPLIDLDIATFCVDGN
eukprot:TRINITY_DN7391_c0_g1_i1.p2 TRINITY_DN7391_c0_g1~~TRINITY_DN7391_c0_g1_i1.p2  ORF type:complete len:110 (-),score=18.88 TRINITY_DN7391_c0_g1_i1:259-588(-)